MLKLYASLLIARSLSCIALLATVETGHTAERAILAGLVVLFWISAAKIATRYTQQRTIDELTTMAFGRTVPSYRGNDR